MGSRLLENKGAILIRYVLIPMILCFLVNCVIYWVTQHLMSGVHHHDFTTAFDRWVPFSPIWSILYMLSFPIWAFMYFYISYKDYHIFKTLIVSDMLSKCVCGIVFLLLPTTNVRPVLTDGPYRWIMENIYDFDLPYNLFPSIHCLISWLAFIAFRRSDKIDIELKVWAFFMASAICISTQMIKQHYIVDVIGAVVIGEMIFAIVNRRGIYKKFSFLFSK